MKKLLVALAIVASSVLCADEPPRMPAEYCADAAEVFASAKDVSADRFPDADMVTIEDKIHTKYFADGTYQMWDDEWIMVLTEKGRRELSTITLGVSLRYGDAAIECVEIIGTNGVVRTVDFKKTLKMATDNSSMNSNIYDPLDKNLMCAVPGLAVGEIRHVRYTRRTLKARMKNTWADLSMLEYTAPIIATTISVDQPNDLPVVHAAVRNPFSNTVTRAENKSLGNNRTLLSWTAKDVPQAFPEPNMPPMYTQTQLLTLSTIKNWQDVSKWYWQLCLPHLAATTPEMTNEVKRLVKDCKTDMDKVRAIFKFVSQEIRYMGLTTETEAPGYEPHDVKMTFDNRYGVCRDKAVLLVALFQIAGLKAYPILIHVDAKKDSQIPNPYFNHAITAVEISDKRQENETGYDGKYWLMDPTDESARDLFPSYLSNRSFIVARPEGDDLRTSPVVPVQRNTMDVDASGVLNADGSALVKYEINLGGINDNAFRDALLRKTPQERSEMFERFFKRISKGAELLALKITPVDLRNTDETLKVVADVRFYDLVLNGEESEELTLPLFTREMNLASMMLEENTSLETRRFPLVFSTTVGANEVLKLELPDELGKVKKLPEDFSVTPKSATNSFVCSLKMRLNGKCLTVERNLSLKAVEFSVGAYGELREALKEIETAERKNPLFAVNKNENADTRIKSVKQIVHFVSPKSWVTTNIVEREILTYQGKKNHSELEFTYVPCARSVEVVEATVSNRNGNVLFVTPKEINEMDGSWVAKAPRYPASKILVVNLPGVEIGSVIRTTVVDAVTNSPVAYWGSYSFGDADPTDFECLEYHVPADVNLKVITKNLEEVGVVQTIVTNADDSCVLTLQAKDLKGISKEPSQASALSWRAVVRATAQDWESFGEELSDALDAARDAGSEDATRIAKEITKDCATPSEKIGAIRKYLAKNMRTAGPGLFALPFNVAFSSPDKALKDSYASATDMRNLLRVMLEAAGFDTEFLLSADDALDKRKSEEVLRIFPCVADFPYLFIRAEADGEVFWLGGENEWTPPEASAYFNDMYFDLDANEFGFVRPIVADKGSWYLPWTWFAASPTNNPNDWIERNALNVDIDVRENGAVDIKSTTLFWGSRIGALRKAADEMLPEKKSRVFQGLVGDIAQNATATSELVMDTMSYPYKMEFSAYVPGYATIDDDSITLKINDFDGTLFSIGGPVRVTPFKIAGNTESQSTYVIRFPEGYTKMEFEPQGFVIRNPLNDEEVWVEHDVKSSCVSNVLTVTVSRKDYPKRAVEFKPEFYPYFKEWNRKSSAPQCKTITVRKK